MSKRITALLIAALPFTARAAVDNFTVDPIHSSVNFTVEHLGIAPIYGKFAKFSGKFALDRAAKSGSAEVTIETASVDTGDSDKGNRARSRDDHLRTADFFNAAEFPRMNYKSTSVAFNGDVPTRIDGNLTLLGATKPVTLALTRFKCNPATATAKERCGGEATGKLMRSEFGMKRGIPSIGDEITLIIAFEGDKDP